MYMRLLNRVLSVAFYTYICLDVNDLAFQVILYQTVTASMFDFQ